MPEQQSFGMAEMKRSCLAHIETPQCQVAYSWRTLRAKIISNLSRWSWWADCLTVWSRRARSSTVTCGNQDHGLLAITSVGFMGKWWGTLNCFQSWRTNYRILVAPVDTSIMWLTNGQRNLWSRHNHIRHTHVIIAPEDRDSYRARQSPNNLEVCR